MCRRIVLKPGACAATNGSDITRIPEATRCHRSDIQKGKLIAECAHVSGDVGDATRRSQGEEAVDMAARRAWLSSPYYELSYIQRNARPGLHV